MALRSIAITASTVLALALGAGAASASTLQATNVIDYSPGPGVSVGRDDPLNALGSTDSNFVALGFGGSITLGFGEIGLGPVTVWEVTFNDPASDGHFESADVFAVLGGIETMIGSVTNSSARSSAGQTLAYAGQFDAVKIVDTTPGTSTSFDGFDVDAVTVAAIPLPASIMLLLSGVLGLGAFRRFKR